MYAGSSAFGNSFPVGVSYEVLASDPRSRLNPDGWHRLVPRMPVHRQGAGKLAILADLQQ